MLCLLNKSTNCYFYQVLQKIVTKTCPPPWQYGVAFERPLYTYVMYGKGLLVLLGENSVFWCLERCLSKLIMRTFHRKAFSIYFLRGILFLRKVKTQMQNKTVAKVIHFKTDAYSSIHTSSPLHFWSSSAYSHLRQHSGSQVKSIK